ncbi:hypothetical protein ABIB25_001921 [Nakamurella sp. UYEF19]|uniref:anti-sigma factor family protein n=1 Tax=Nakamurella sp. UYEF19 TaxID=1756392 RepID=UPI003392C791
MNDLSHRELREMLGYYVTGKLDEPERLSLQAHLDGCAACRAEVAELRGTVRKLDLVDVARIDSEPSPPPGLGEDVIRHVRAAQSVRRPRRSTPLLIAAAIAALAIGLGAGWWLKPTPATVALPPTETVAVQVDRAPVDASAKLINHTWGVEIQLTASGFETGHAYQVEMINTRGERSSAGEFVGTGTRQMRCNLNSAVLRADAAGFEVLDHGAVLVSSTF